MDHEVWTNKRKNIEKMWYKLVKETASEVRQLHLYIFKIWNNGEIRYLVDSYIEDGWITQQINSNSYYTIESSFQELQNLFNNKLVIL